MQPRFNFSQFYENEQLSDVLLLVRIDGDVKQRIPGHGIVLANVSHVFRGEIEQQQGLGGKPALHLDVRPDQVPAACALVRFVYTGDLPDPTASQQPLLVHMLHLAHTFGVTDCRTACFNVLMQCHQLQPEPLGLAFMLLAPLTARAAAAPAHAPATAAPGPHAAGFQQLLDHCLNQLQQQLGDMESVLSCPDLLAQLHSLPLPALLALLHDERTSAASENTVLAAVHSWMTAAAQRDVRVDAVQREQLAAAVRVPLLEPCYLGTVLPRMAWLLEILGPQGLATAAGVARGLCDPHAEPVLSNARACGSLAAGWLKGPRPVPASCSRAMHGGPALTIEWTLPLSDIKAAFEAACADAVSKALARQQQEAAVAAAAAQQAALVSTEPPTWGLGSFRSPLAPASAAAAMSAVASVAAAAAARVFNKRKHSCTVTESYDGEGRDQQSSSTAALGLDQNRKQPVHQQDGACEEEGQEAAGPLLSQPMSPGAQQGEHSQGGLEGGEDLPQHTRKRRRRAVGAIADTPGAEPAKPAAAATTPRARSSQGAKKPPALQMQQQGAQVVQLLSPQAAAAANAAAGGAAGAAAIATFSQGPAPTSPTGLESFSSGVHHLPRQFKLRSQEARFAGYTWRLVLYFQPKGAAGGAAGAHAAAGAAAGYGEADPQHADARASGDVKRQAVAAAHAVRLPGEQPAGTAAGVARCMWSARLAVEAWPAVALQPASNSSTVAFSGSLGVRLAPEGNETAAAAAAAQGGGRARNCSKAGSKQRQARGRSGAASPAALLAAGDFQDAAPSPGRRLNLAASDSPARYATCLEAAAAAAAAAGGPAGATLPGAGADGHRGLHAQAGLMSIPESYEGSLSESSGQLSSSSDEQQKKAAAVQDNDGDDEGFTMLGEYPAGTTPRSSRLRKQQQQQQHSRSARRRPAPGGEQEAQQQDATITPGMPAGPGCGSCDDEGAWRVLQLPQGSWLRSRRCDTGYTSFFCINLHQAEWNEAAWQPYLQPGDVLQLRGTIWNVR